MAAIPAVAPARERRATCRKLSRGEWGNLALVLLGDYYPPNAHVDALHTAPVALPVLGDVMRYIVTAVYARLLLNRLVRAMCAPREVPRNFMATLSREMMVRPIQLRAKAEDAVFMVPQARASSERHHELRMPVATVAGAGDKMIDVEAHSRGCIASSRAAPRDRRGGGAHGAPRGAG